MKYIGEKHSGVCTNIADETRGFVFNHTMLRVKDPKISLEFYSRVLGMQVLRKLDFEELEFSLYFLAKLEEGDSLAPDLDNRSLQTFAISGVLELTHNWGTEEQQDFAYHNGNGEPQGFGHICFSVPNLDSAIKWLDANKVEFVKRPEDGKLRDVAFIKDPDGYWIEIIQAEKMLKFNN